MPKKLGNSLVLAMPRFMLKKNRKLLENYPDLCKVLRLETPAYSAGCTSMFLTAPHQSENYSLHRPILTPDWAAVWVFKIPAEDLLVVVHVLAVDAVIKCQHDHLRDVLDIETTRNVWANTPAFWQLAQGATAFTWNQSSSLCHRHDKHTQRYETFRDHKEHHAAEGVTTQRFNFN